MRILFFLAIIAILVALFFVVKKFLQPSSHIRCSRCDGKGFWLGARGREKCDWCNGSGRLYRDV